MKERIYACLAAAEQITNSFSGNMSRDEYMDLVVSTAEELAKRVEVACQEPAKVLLKEVPNNQLLSKLMETYRVEVYNEGLHWKIFASDSKTLLAEYWPTTSTCITRRRAAKLKLDGDRLLSKLKAESALLER